MPKNFFLILFIVSFVLIIIFLFVFRTQPLTKTEVQINNKKFILEIATTISQKTKGLSNRNSLCNNCGMVFVYNQENIYPFWMKDTLIPLDMIWINNLKEIVAIHTAEPEPNTPIYKLKIYQNTKPAKYIIELNKGEAEKLGLKIGDKINFNL